MAEPLSLITATPEEGRQLAIMLARKSVVAMQPDPEVRKALRPDYAKDTMQLMIAAQVVALEFQTIALANSHWKHVSGSSTTDT